MSSEEGIVSKDEIVTELQDEDSVIQVATAITGVPEAIAYGEAYTITAVPPEAEYETGLYRIDKSANEIKVAEGMVIGIPAWNSRLAKNFPEGTYRLIVKSLGNVLVSNEYQLARPANDRNKIVKARQ